MTATVTQAIEYAIGRREWFAVTVQIGNRTITVGPHILAMDETEALRRWRRYNVPTTVAHWERQASRIYARPVR